MLLVVCLLASGVVCFHAKTGQARFEEIRDSQLVYASKLQSLRDGLVQDRGEGKIVFDDIHRMLGDDLSQIEADLKTVTLLSNGAVAMTVVLGVLALLAVVGFVRSARSRDANLPAKARTSLLRVAGENEVPAHTRSEIDEAVASFDALMDKLGASFQSIAGRMREIDHAVETLTSGARQVVADQANLFALNAAIEAARPQQDGFTMVADEICSLAGQATHLTEEIRNMATRIQVSTREVMAELEDLARQITSGSSLEHDVDDGDPALREETNKITQAISAIADALQVDPVRVVSGIVQLQAAMEISSALQENEPDAASQHQER